MERGAPWNICIDIEGFSALWGQPGENDRVLWALGELLRGVFRIGRKVYPEEPYRLFAIQAGDGVFIHSSFHEHDLRRAACVAVVLMRHVAAGGRFSKAGIAEGEVADINGCYPREVMDEQDKNGMIRLGAGRLFTFPYMGPGIINSAAIAKTVQKVLSLLSHLQCGIDCRRVGLLQFAKTANLSVPSIGCILKIS